MNFPFGIPCFKGRTVSFREGNHQGLPFFILGLNFPINKSLHSPKLNSNIAPDKEAVPKGKDCIPNINFQVRKCYIVSTFIKGIDWKPWKRISRVCSIYFMKWSMI